MNFLIRFWEKIVFTNILKNIIEEVCSFQGIHVFKVNLYKFKRIDISLK